MNNEDIKTVRLLLNSEQANKQLEEINKQLVTAQKNREKAFESGNAQGIQACAREVKRLERQQRRLQTRAQHVTDVLENLDKATPDKLNKVIKEINKELNSGNVERGTHAWEVLTDQLKKAKAELQKIRRESEANEQSFTDKLKNFGDYWVGFAATAYTAIQGLAGIKDMMRSSVLEYAAMQEHMAGVRKYTGMTTEQVDELNKAFMAMDTRTPREQLNDLAGDAGRLGIQSKQAVLDFVEAADQINVALGEDLGENAVRDIGKLAQLFGDSDRMGLKKAMLSTGSLINDLAQSSSANEGYLMDFTARLAGVGHQAGMSQAQVMAFGSVLDQSMVNVEQGATALQNVITGLYTKPAELARIAGMDVKKFTELLKKDGNAALLQFIQALHDGGGLDKLAPALEAMKLSGAGVTQVLSALATNVDTLRSTQEQATQAFEEGTSVTNEFNTANTTVQAQLEKSKAKFHDVSVELGKELMPVTSHMIGMTSITMKLLIKLIPFVKEHIAGILSLSAVITTYVAIANLAMIKTKAVALAQTVWNKTLAVGKGLMATGTATAYLMQLAYYKVTRQTEKATVAQAKLNSTMLKNPYAAITTAVVALGAAIFMLARRTKSLNSEQKTQLALARALEKGAQKADEERARLTRLNNILNDYNLKLKDRQTALREIQSIVPEYHGALSKEGQLINDNSDAITTYIGKLTQLAQAQALEQELQEQYKKKYALERDQKRKENNVRAVERELGKEAYKEDYQLVQGGIVGSHYEDMNARRRKKKTEELNAQKGRLNKINGELSQTQREIAAIETQMKSLGIATDVVVKTINGDEENGAFDLTDDDALKKKASAIKTAAQQKKIAKQVEYQNGLISHRQYTQALADIDVRMYEDIKAVYDKNSAEYVEAEKNRLDTISKLKKEQRAWSIEDLDRQYAEERQNVKDNYLHGLLDEEQYHKQLIDANLNYLKKKAEYYRQWGMLKEADAADTAYEAANQEEQMNRQQEFWKKVDKFKKDFLKKSAEEQMQFDLDFAEQLHKNGILSEEEYQKALKSIRDKYNGKKDDEYEWGGGSPTDALSQGVISLFDSISALQEHLKSGEASWQDWAAVGVASLGMVSAIAGSVSQLIQANLAIEEKKVNERYDSEIKQAGNNKKKKKKLEEAREKELAALKTKYAKKAMAMQITQAIASTAQNAIMAYGSVLVPGVPWTYPLAAIAAGAAVASGMLQVAAIKKQAKAQSEGYYEGGFTNGRNYRKQAGVVHEGEFVANHYAVNNPHLLPVFNLLDMAQRNNTVGSLTPADVSRSISAPMTAASGSAGLVQVIDSSSVRTAEVLERLSNKMEEPVKAYVVISGPDGLDKQWKKYQKMNDL